MQQRPGPRTTAGRGFAVKFYDILDKESSDIITWTQSGQAFQVLDYTRFSEEILLKYFRHNKFSSFRRQLNLYGYRKVIKGPDAGAYMHPFFQRGRRDLLGEVKKGKVPHYDIHGVNEIHGQHFRHHPPGAKNKEIAARLQAHPAQLSPALDAQSSPVVTPEIRGEDGYGNLAVHGPPGARMMQSPSQPVPHMTPGTQAASALSNMSLSPAPHQNNTWGPPAPQPGQGMDALTLTPAWGGAAGSAGSEGGAPGAASQGKQTEEGKGGAGASAGGSGSGSGGVRGAGADEGPVPGNRLAYWEKSRKRRTMSAQVVFSLQPPENTEVIDQADPSLCDVMDVICQCMEVRSSSESQQSQLSTLSGCSFNLDPMRRTSISDLLTCMSWESAWRNSGALRGSLAGSVDPTMFDGDSGDAGIRISGGSTGVGGGSDGVPNTNSHDDTTAPPRPNLQQQASFDPTRDPSGVSNSGLIGGMTQPAVIAASPLSSAGGGGGGPRDHGDGGGGSSSRNNQEQQEDPRPASRPSFDPNRESSIADGIRAAGGGQDSRINGAARGEGGGGGGGDRGQGGQVSRDGASQAAFVGSVGGGAGSSGNNSGSMSRETSRGSTAKRIFKSAPPPSSAAATGGGGGRYHEGWANGSGRINSADSSSTVGPAIAPTVPAAGPPEGNSNSGAGVNHDPVHWVLPSSQASATGAGMGGTSSTWGLSSQEQLQHLQASPPVRRQGDGSTAGLGRVVSAATISSAATVATISSAASSSASTEGAQVFSRPRLGRMESLQWLTEPTPCRRPTINETHEVNRLLSNQANFEAWARVADDPDSIMLAKNIGDFLG